MPTKSKPGIPRADDVLALCSMADIGAKLRFVRTSLGHTQQALARAARCSVRTIQRAEHGTYMTLRLLRAAAELFEVPLFYLLIPVGLISDAGDFSRRVEHDG